LAHAGQPGEHAAPRDRLVVGRNIGLAARHSGAGTRREEVWRPLAAGRVARTRADDLDEQLAVELEICRAVIGASAQFPRVTGGDGGVDQVQNFGAAHGRAPATVAAAVRRFCAGGSGVIATRLFEPPS
jgi:hypothetical protein